MLHRLFHFSNGSFFRKDRWAKEIFISQHQFHENFFVTHFTQHQKRINSCMLMKVQSLANIWADDGHELIVVDQVLKFVIRLPQFGPREQGLRLCNRFVRNRWKGEKRRYWYLLFRFNFMAIMVLFDTVWVILPFLNVIIFGV
jgi:hypothetical protein